MKLLKQKGLMNWLTLASSTALVSLLNFIIFIIMGRKMSVEAYAQFSTIIALGTTVATFVNNIASGTVLNREIAVKTFENGRYIRKAFIIRFLGFIVALFGLYLYIDTKQEYTQVIILCIFALFSYEVFYEFFEQVAFGYKQTKFSSLISICGIIVLLVYMLILPPEYCSLDRVLCAYTVINVLKYVVYYLCDRTLFKKTALGAEVVLGDIIKPSIPYFWMRAIGVLSTQVPVLLLDGYAESAEVSYYSVGNKFTLPMTILVNTGIKAFFPYFTQYYNTNRDKYKKFLFLMLSMALLASSALAVILSVTCSWWLPIIMGSKYDNAVEPFKIQVWYTCILCVDLIISMALSSSFKQKILAVITTIDVVLLMPALWYSLQFGAIGVSISKLICAVICLLYHVVILIKVMHPLKGEVGRIWLQVGVMGVCLACTIVLKNTMVQCGIAFGVLMVALFAKNSPLKEICKMLKNI